MKKLLTVLLFAPVMASAEFYSGNDLYEKMESADKAEKLLGLGYVMGVFDAHRLVTHCAPTSVTGGQVYDMIYQYLKLNPSVRNNSADMISAAVFANTWACPKKKEPNKGKEKAA